MPLVVVMFSSDGAEFVDQTVGIDVIEAVACGHIGLGVGEQCGDVGIFAVEVDHIGSELALAAAGKNCAPDNRVQTLACSAQVSLRLNHWPQGPSVRPGALSMKGWCADSWMTKRLMPFRNSWSAVGFRVCGRPCPRGRCIARGHGFRGGDVLSVDVRHGSGLAIIGVVAVCGLVDAGLLHPHGAHGNVVELLHFHAVSDEGAARLVRLAVVAHAALFQ